MYHIYSFCSTSILHSGFSDNSAISKHAQSIGQGFIQKNKKQIVFHSVKQKSKLLKIKLFVSNDNELSLTL